MILWFLRLINHPILAQLSQCETDKVMLQDRLERSDQERARLWDQVEGLQGKLDLSYQMQVNV